MTDGAVQFDFLHEQYPAGSGGEKQKHLFINKENFKNIKNPLRAFKIRIPF